MSEMRDYIEDLTKTDAQFTSIYVQHRRPWF